MAQLPDNTHVFFEGRAATDDDVKEAAHTLYLGDLPEPEVHAFGSEDTLLDWANLRQDWQRVAHMLGVERLARHAKGGDLARARKLHEARYARLREDLDQLKEETGLEGLDLFRRATVGAPAFEGPASQSAFLFRAAGDWLHFLWLPHHIPMPDFGWYGMNDRGTFMTFVSPWGGALYSDTWFRGRILYFWGICFGLPLTPLGWAGIASSGWDT
jgi:hypothetical protein